MRHSQNTLAWSNALFGGVRQLFLTATTAEDAAQPDDWRQQTAELLESLRTVLEREHVAETVMMSHFFLKDLGKKELVQRIVAEIFPSGLGAVTFIPQAPAFGSACLGLEIWAMGETDKVKIVRETPLSGQVTTAEFGGVRWFFGGGANRSGPLADGAYRHSLDSFEQLEYQLQMSGFSVNQLVRTWIYQGRLLQAEGDTQRYKELNRARTDYFAEHQIDRYPASTGIGADNDGVIVAALAISPRNASTRSTDMKIVPLENPQQISAFDYGAVYSPQSPKFARAMAVSMQGDTSEDSCLIFVSGTASITDSESRHINDPLAQTELTLDNIAALIDGANLARHGLPGFCCDLSNLKCVRIYVKRPSDVETIRTICQQRLGNVPMLYTWADVCRPELLVEIEGIAVTQKEKHATS